MKIQEYLDKDLLIKMIDLGYVLVNKHPEFNLYILNYSTMCTIDKIWNDVTEKCRGLIVDDNGYVIARPFKKFFNYEEIEDKSIIPNLPFEVYDKMDGSLGILYFYNNVPYIATKGSFTSEQAIIGTKILRNKDHKSLDPNLTYLFEIITPDDPKVVDYQLVEDLFLLAVINTETGEEYNIENFKNVFPVTKIYKNVSDWKNLREQIDGTNREGFVIKFSNNFRVKLKYAEYFNLHKILYGLNDNAIFNMLSNNQLDDLMALIHQLPIQQEFRLLLVIQQYLLRFNQIKNQCNIDFKNDFKTRKEAAEYFKTCDYPSVMFAMLDGKDISSYIWKIINKER